MNSIRFLDVPPDRLSTTHNFSAAGASSISNSAALFLPASYLCLFTVVRQKTPQGNIEQELPKTQQAPASGSSNGGGGGSKGDRTAVSKDEAAAPPGAEKQQGEIAPEGKNKASEEQQRAQAEEEDEATRIREEDAEKLYQSELCDMPEAPDPRLFVEGLTLRRYQRQALAWMIQREKKRYVTEEDCTGLSMGAAAAAAGGAAAEAEPAAKYPARGAAAGNNGREEDSSVSIRDGCVSVASWSRSATNGVGGADCGGGAGVAMHPLWERRVAASRASRTAPASASSEGGSADLSEGGMFGAVSVPNGAPAGEKGSLLSQPEAFYVNVYSRRFQRDFPPATLGCRGGILADEMGMGKVRGRGERGGARETRSLVLLVHAAPALSARW